MALIIDIEIMYVARIENTFIFSIDFILFSVLLSY